MMYILILVKINPLQNNLVITEGPTKIEEINNLEVDLVAKIVGKEKSKDITKMKNNQTGLETTLLLKRKNKRLSLPNNHHHRRTTKVNPIK